MEKYNNLVKTSLLGTLNHNSSQSLESSGIQILVVGATKFWV